MRNRIRYSQNFLKSPILVRELIDRTSIGVKDTVYEIGAGSGIITDELLKQAGKVVAFEIDINLYNKLSNRFGKNESLKLVSSDFLDCELPKHPYKVFSNIPFRLTSDIIRKLTFTITPPTDCYLIIQRQAVMKFAGKLLAQMNSQMSVLLHPWFEFNQIYKFEQTDFFPIPSVEVVLLHINHRSSPIISDDLKNKYQDFITYAFNQRKPSLYEGLSELFDDIDKQEVFKNSKISIDSKPSELDFADWTILFEKFMQLPKVKQIKVQGSFSKQIANQNQLSKIHRTRTDRHWRSKVY